MDWPEPWEDHQGLTDEELQPLILALLGQVRLPPRPRTDRLY
jgi:hypothetical protein